MSMNVLKFPRMALRNSQISNLIDLSIFVFFCTQIRHNVTINRSQKSNEDDNENTCSTNTCAAVQSGRSDYVRHDA